MDGEARRDKIIELLKNRENPVSGTELSKIFKVSRQVIVQDIALLRAVNKNILSTNKGYLLYIPGDPAEKFRTAVRVKHTTEEIRDELYTIVDCGAKVLDVVVEHEIYGQITVDLYIASRQDADEFVAKIERYRTRPLKELTGGIHLHTIEAGTRDTLDKTVDKLREKGYIYS